MWDGPNVGRSAGDRGAMIVRSWSDINSILSRFNVALIRSTSSHDVLDKIISLDMKGCICHFTKWQIHPFIYKGTKISSKIPVALHASWLQCALSKSQVTKMVFYPAAKRGVGWSRPGEDRLFIRQVNGIFNVDIIGTAVDTDGRVPENTRHWPNADLMLAQRRRH